MQPENGNAIIHNWPAVLRGDGVLIGLDFDESLAGRELATAG
jgi:hypothetical protein